MLTRRHLAGLLATAPLAPAFAQAPSTPTAMPEAGRRPWAQQVPQIRLGN